MAYDLEVDLEQLRSKLKDRKYAQAVYAAMCNNEFEKEGEKWSCSWRYAGGMVARLRGEKEMYLDYYCSGIGSELDEPTVPEGVITDEVRKDIETLGWEIK